MIKQLSVLLASASSGGTIAAVRHLAESGIQVGVLASELLCAASWSNRATRRYSAPPETESDRFLERLLAIGVANPGQILLPTSDETAWLYTLNAPALAKHFCVYQPSIATMQRILDKNLFSAAAIKAGVGVLPCWDPLSLEELVTLAANLPYPILIKPRTHVHRFRNDKGIVVNSASELIQNYKLFINREEMWNAEDILLPRARVPLLQQFVDVTNAGVHSITGFIDRTGELFVARRSTKVFQRSKPAGVGVCFESLPSVPILSEAVRSLCRELDYFGLFEVEFVWFDGSWAAIDFNPRLFNQIGMDIRRGMPLPLLACLDAAGERAALQDAVARAQAEADHTNVALFDGFTLRAILFAQIITGRISRQDRKYWRAWMKEKATHAVDWAVDARDPMPGFIHAVSEVKLGLKALPQFLRSTPRASHVSMLGVKKGRS